MGKKNAFDEAYTERQAGRSALRKAIRRIFIRRNIKHAVGKTLDFGCGTGELLKHLPEGSVGLDINPASVAYCASLGLDARLYDPDADQYRFLDYAGAGFQTFLLCHVLEHIPEPLARFKQVLESCRELGVERVILVAPGKKGFHTDPTHDTLIDMDLLRSGALDSCAGFSISGAGYFPINTSWAGDYMVHNELNILYTREPSGEPRPSPPLARNSQ